MTVTSLDTDYDNLTTTLVADFDAPIAEVWQLWAEGRQQAVGQIDGLLAAGASRS
jgi:hypothetical protein